MIYIDIKYANMLLPRLDKWSVKRQMPYLANGRCPYCGDSTKNKFTRRGYILQKSSLNYLLYYCHKCGKSTTLSKMLSETNPDLYKDYRVEMIKESSGGGKPDTVEEIKSFKPDISKFAKRRIDKDPAFMKLKKISSLPPNHVAKQYVVSRGIPSDQHYRLYYCPAYMAWVNESVPNKFSAESIANKDEPRLVIPFVDRAGHVFAFQGRSFNPNSKIKYITIVLDEDAPRVFGLDTFEPSKHAIVVEGPLDAMFLPNTLALAGGDNDDIYKVVSKENTTFLFDNEPRHKDTLRRMEKAITLGYAVSLLPSTIVGKDVNDIIKNKEASAEELTGIIFRNSYSGNTAKIKLAQWRKI